MPKSLPFTLFVSLIVISVLGILIIEPLPTYAQEVISTIPDLSGVNIYFSETYQEMSQFDRSDAGISRFAGLLRLAGANLFTLEWRKGIPEDADLIIIANPSTDMTADNIARLWSYLQGGGRVLLVVDPFDNKGAVSRALGSRGLFELTWADLGLQARADVVVIQNGTRQIEVTEKDKDGAVTFQFSGEAPVFETAFFTRHVDTNHPITAAIAPLVVAMEKDATANLNSLYFNGARSLQIDSSLQDFDVTPLIFTDIADIYGETDYARYLTNGYSEYNIGRDSQRGDLILAAAYADRDSTGRMVLLGDGDFVRNGSGFVTSPSYSGSFVYPVNVQFMLRSVAWLLDREPTILTLPTPAATATATITPTPTPVPTVTPTSP